MSTLVALLQTWHAVSPPPQDFPFAFTDGRSIKNGNWVVMDNYTSLENSDEHTVETRLGLYDPGECLVLFLQHEQGRAADFQWLRQQIHRQQDRDALGIQQYCDASQRFLSREHGGAVFRVLEAGPRREA
jgi:hypothetical protein